MKKMKRVDATVAAVVSALTATEEMICGRYAHVASPDLFVLGLVRTAKGIVGDTIPALNAAEGMICGTFYVTDYERFATEEDQVLHMVREAKTAFEGLWK